MAPGHAIVRMDAALDAAAPHLHTHPLHPSFCTHDPRVNPYLPDMDASPRRPCCCLWTTPPSAMDADALHRHGTITSAPVNHLMCPDVPDAHHDAVNNTTTSPWTRAACNLTSLSAP